MILPAALIAGALSIAGCSSSSTSTGAAGSQLPSSITVWSYDNNPGPISFENQAAKLFNEQYPTVKVNLVTIPGSQLEGKILAAAATHAGPDAIVGYCPACWFSALAAAGSFYNMTSYWNSFGGRTGFNPNAIYTYNGKIYTVQSYFGVWGLYYNKTLLNSLGLSVPTTLSALDSDLAVIKAHGDTGIVQPMGVGNGAGMDAFIRGAGASYCTAGNNSKAAEAAFSTLAGWTNDGYEPRAVVTYSQPDALAAWIQGKTAFLYTGDWESATATSEAKFQWGVEPLPAGLGGEYSTVGGEGQAIGAFTKYPQIVWKYLEDGWFSQTAQSNIINTVGELPANSQAAASVRSDPYQAQLLNQHLELGLMHNANFQTEQNGEPAIETAVVSGQLSANQAAQKFVALVNSSKVSAGGGACAAPMG